MYDELFSKMVLAPMAGYTDHPFRQLCRENGAGLVFTELISAEGLVRSNEATRFLLKNVIQDKPIAVQLFGNNEHTISRAAKLLDEHSPDFIDINMGCSVPKVCKNGSGADLLRDPVKIYNIIYSTVKNSNSKITAKIRIGWNEELKNYRDVVNALTDAGVSFITVHGRTKTQQFKGLADWNIIEEIASFSKVPIIGNGDVVSYQDGISKKQKYNCAGIMIGRACIGNPWIFNGKIPTVEEKLKTAIRHIVMMEDFYGSHGITLSRKHIARYLSNFKNSSVLRCRIFQTTNLEEIKAILCEIR